MQQRSLQRLRVSVSLIFLIHGLIIATWASRIPAFQVHLHLSPAVLGRSLMMAAIGSVLTMPVAGWLINKFGSLSIVTGSTELLSEVLDVFATFETLDPHSMKRLGMTPHFAVIHCGEPAFLR